MPSLKGIISILFVPILLGVAFFLFVLVHSNWEWIIVHPISYLSVVWIIYCISEGKLHAYYYAHEITSSLKENFNEHKLFTIMRLCVIVPILVLIKWKLFLCLCLMQPFLHNGSYYLHRNKLDGSYPKNWFAQSSTSTAWSTKFLTPLIRTALFTIGLGVLIYLSR